METPIREGWRRFSGGYVESKRCADAKSEGKLNRKGDTGRRKGGMDYGYAAGNAFRTTPNSSSTSNGFVI